MSLHNFPCLGHGSIGLCVERSTCARCQVCTFMSVVLLRHERPAAAGFLFYGVVTPQCRGNDECLLSGKHTGFYQNRCSRFFAPKCRRALRIYHQERWKQEMKFRRKWKPGGHPRRSSRPYHRYREKRLLNKPRIKYETEEECIHGKRKVLRSANSRRYRRSAA